MYSGSDYTQAPPITLRGRLHSGVDYRQTTPGGNSLVTKRDQCVARHTRNLEFCTWTKRTSLILTVTYSVI